MRLARVLLLLSILLLFCSLPASANRLSILTYNLQGRKPGTDPDTRILHIIENLKHLDPDIIGLQEINEFLSGQGNQAEIIADSLTSHFGIEYHVYSEFTHLSWDNQFRELIGIISKYPVLEEGYGQLVTGVFPRKVVWNAIDTPAGIVNFFNTHLSFNSASIRELQVQQIIGFINEKENAVPGIGMVLVGDFNSTPETDAIELLTDTGTTIFYIDTFAETNPGSPGYTVPSDAPNARIDYVFEKNTSDMEILRSQVVIDEPYDGTNYCSDHLGVLTVLRRDETGTCNGPPGSAFSLLSPRPNPSDGTALIPYELDGNSMIDLSVYNVAGRHMKTLIHGVRSAGRHEMIWDCTDVQGIIVPSETYVVRLKVDGSILDHPLTVLR